MKFLAVIVLSLSAILALGQSGDAVFMVKKKTSIYLSPPFDSLFETNTYRFKVVGIEHKEIAQGTMKHGKVMIGDTDIVVIVDTLYADTLKSILQLYVMEGGKLEPVLAKQFTLLRKPELVLGKREGFVRTSTYNAPPPNVDWLRDTVLSVKKRNEQKFYLMNDLVVWPQNDYAKVVAFNMEIMENAENKTYYSGSSQLTSAMKGGLKLMGVGASIKFYNIRCLRPDLSNDVITMPDHIIRVTD